MIWIFSLMQVVDLVKSFRTNVVFFSFYPLIKLDCDSIKTTIKIVQRDQHTHVWLKCTTMMNGRKLPKGTDGQDHSTKKSSRSFIFTYKLTGNARNKRSQFRERERKDNKSLSWEKWVGIRNRRGKKKEEGGEIKRREIERKKPKNKKNKEKRFWLKMEVFWARK